MDSRGRKGQVYIITTVFLSAMVFAIYSLLMGYSAIDISGYHHNSDTYAMHNLESIFQAGLDSSNNCEEAKENVDELTAMFDGMISGSYEISILGELECPGGSWPSGTDLTLEVTLDREDGESTQTLRLDH